MMVHGDDNLIAVDQNSDGSFTVRYVGVVPTEASETEAGLTAYYFSASKVSDTSVKVSNIRYRYGGTQGTLADQTLTIPTTAGTYYVYLQAAYSTSYSVSVAVSAVNTNPTQVVTGTTRYWREEICAVVVADSVISQVLPIWPGHIMAIEGRVV